VTSRRVEIERRIVSAPRVRADRGEKPANAADSAAIPNTWATEASAIVSRTMPDEQTGDPHTRGQGPVAGASGPALGHARGAPRIEATRQTEAEQ